MSGLKAGAIDPLGIDIIVISHLHGDHFGGLPFFLVEAEVLSRRAEPLLIVGPPGLGERLERAIDNAFPGANTAGWRFRWQVIELSARTPGEVGFLRITTFPVSHFSGTAPHALRIECGDKVVAYSGDTGWTPVLAEVAKDADLFICEAYHFDKASRYHLDYKSLLSHRNELTCRRIIVTHLGEDMVKRAGDLELEAAADGMTIAV
jgi:ribonuclease BN (tRNA processing enzyme)